MFRSLTLILLTTSFQGVLGNAGDAPIGDFSEPPPDIRKPTDPGQLYATIVVPPFEYQNRQFTNCDQLTVDTESQINIGVTTVTCTSGDISVSFTVDVYDCEPPIFTTCELAGNTVIAPDGTSTAVVNYNIPAAMDNDGFAPTIVCEPPSGSTFPIGSHPIRCTATDKTGNSASVVSHTVSVVAICGPHQLPIDGSPCDSCDTGMVRSADREYCLHCPKGTVRGNRDGTGETGCLPAAGICDVHERAVAGACTACNRRQVASSDYVKCEHCAVGSVFDLATQECVSGVCEAWERAANGRCIKCLDGKIGKINDIGCEFCPNGTVRGNSAGRMKSDCVSDEICDEGEVGFGGKCVPGRELS